MFFYAHEGAKAGKSLDAQDVVLPGGKFIYTFAIDSAPLVCFRDNSVPFYRLSSCLAPPLQSLG